MFRRIAVFSSLVLVAACPARGQSDSYLLRWNNGDEAVGQIVSASADRLVWNSAVSSQDVMLNLSVLDSISPLSDDDATWRTVEEVRETLDPPESEFLVMLAQGMTLSGDLKAITPTHVTLTNNRLGDVTVDRRWINKLSVGRLPPGGATSLIDLVGEQASGWRSIDQRWEHKTPKLRDWDVSEPGRVATSSAGARLYFSTELPSLCDIELTAGSTRNPQFSLAFGSIRNFIDGSGELRLEAGGDELVISSAMSNQNITLDPINQLGVGTRRVSLRLLWDRQTGEVSVFNLKGRLLAETRMASAPEIIRGGILLENSGADLTVTRLKVSSPDAEESPPIVEGENQLRTMEGRLYFGTLSGPDDEGNIEIRFGNNVARVAIEDVAEIRLVSPLAEPEAAEENCWLTYRDGTALQGEMIGIENGRASLRVAFSSTPIVCPLAGLKRCEFLRTGDESPSIPGHVLTHAGHDVRGTLGGAEATLTWRFVGAEAAIRLNLNDPLTIRRFETVAGGPEFTEAIRDVVLLKSGDLLPCRIESIDEEFVEISTDFSAAVQIPQDELQAVSFGAEQMQRISGFQAEAWQINGNQPDDVERSGDAIVFHDTATVSHPTLLSGGNLEFDVDWNRTGQSYLIMTLMQNLNVEQNAAFGRMFVVPDRRMFYLMFNEDNVVVYLVEGNAGRAVEVRQAIRTSDPIHVRIRQVDDNVALLLDEQEQGSMRVPDAAEGAMGVTFQTQARDGDLNTTISNLQATRGEGLFFHLPIRAAAREHVVTVPRMRRDRPPSHVLIGRNGDLLRGRLLSLGPSSAQFESRLNDVVLPRDRLSGIVWLTEPAREADDGDAPDAVADPPLTEQDESARPDGSVRATFGDGVVLTFFPQRVEGDELVARHRAFGECRFSLASISELLVGTSQNQTDQADDQPTFTEWTLIHAPEPVIPGANGGFGTYSDLVGQPAEDFTLPLLTGGTFRLSEHRGEIVVLDFWASWCGPCIQAMPQLMAATNAFPDDVTFVGVNQEESPDVVSTFLDVRDWNLQVALDRRGEVGRQFRVQGIPQTVIVGRDGTIEHVHLGSSPDLESSLTDVLEELTTESPQASGE